MKIKLIDLTGKLFGEGTRVDEDSPVILYRGSLGAGDHVRVFLQSEFEDDVFFEVRETSMRDLKYADN